MLIRLVVFTTLSWLSCTLAISPSVTSATASNRATALSDPPAENWPCVENEFRVSFSNYQPPVIFKPNARRWVNRDLPDAWDMVTGEPPDWDYSSRGMIFRLAAAFGSQSHQNETTGINAARPTSVISARTTNSTVNGGPPANHGLTDEAVYETLLCLVNWIEAWPLIVRGGVSSTDIIVEDAGRPGETWAVGYFGAAH